ncbi:MAG: Mini-ribonuclease 3 [Clostridia bacterium]|nr:Mini-ribonuclease 3 [Clostridia bacterium]
MESKDLNITALAYLGDAVYEVYIREYLLKKGEIHADELHKMAVKYVSAYGQAKAIKGLMNTILSEDEVKFVKRARNHKYTSKAKNADPVTYKLATAFEALVGKYRLDGHMDRLEEVINRSIAIIEEREDKDE